MKFFLALLVSVLSPPAIVEAKDPPKNCKTHLSFHYIDRRNNQYYSIQGKELKEVRRA